MLGNNECSRLSVALQRRDNKTDERSFIVKEDTQQYEKTSN